MPLASITPLLVVLGAVAGAAIGVLLLRFVRSTPLTPEREEQIRDEAAKRAARRAVNEVIARLR